MLLKGFLLIFSSKLMLFVHPDPDPDPCSKFGFRSGNSLNTDPILIRIWIRNPAKFVSAMYHYGSRKPKLSQKTFPLSL